MSKEVAFLRMFRYYRNARLLVKRFGLEVIRIGNFPCIKMLAHHDCIETAVPHLCRSVSAVF